MGRPPKTRSGGARPQIQSTPCIRARHQVYTSPWMQVIAKEVVNPTGKSPETYFAVQTKVYCSVVALTPERRIVLVRQFRPIVEAVTLELPSGCVEQGEESAEAMQRELVEETGFQCTRPLELLGHLYPDTGRLETRLWAYFAPMVVSAKPLKPRGDGIETVLCTLAELRTLIVNGTFNHALHVGVIGLSILQGRLAL